MDSRGIYGYIYIYHFLASKEERPSTRTDMNRPRNDWIGCNFWLSPKQPEMGQTPHATLPLRHFVKALQSYEPYESRYDIWWLSQKLGWSPDTKWIWCLLDTLCDALRCQFVQKHPEKNWLPCHQGRCSAPNFRSPSVFWKLLDLGIMNIKIWGKVCQTSQTLDEKPKIPGPVCLYN